MPSACTRPKNTGELALAPQKLSGLLPELEPDDELPLEELLPEELLLEVDAVNEPQYRPWPAAPELLLLDPLLELLEEELPLLLLPLELLLLLLLLEPLELPPLELLELLLSLLLPQALSAHAASTISAGFFIIASPEKRRRLLVNPGRCSDFSLNLLATVRLQESCDPPLDFRYRYAA